MCSVSLNTYKVIAVGIKSIKLKYYIYAGTLYLKNYAVTLLTDLCLQADVSTSLLQESLDFL